MSWLTSTISRVREQGGALVKDGARALRERAGQARAVFGRGGGSAAELSADLEKRARRTSETASSTGAKEVEELFQEWVRKLGAAGDQEKEGGARWQQLQRQREATGFRQALLRSRALELVLEAIALDPNLRRHYSSPQAWTSFGIRGLLCQTLNSSEEVWSAVLKAAFGDVELLSEAELTWLIDLISALKTDWRDEDLKAERRELALRAETLVQELRQLDVQDVGERDTARHAKRVELSGELFGLHRALWQNVEDAEEQLNKDGARREEEFNRIDAELTAYAEALKDPANGMEERNRKLQVELQQSHDNLQVELQRIDNERGEMDRAIEDLEAQKRELRQQLDEVNAELRQAQADQRWHMQQCDNQHAQINAIEAQYKSEIRAEDAAILDAQRQGDAIGRTMQVVSDADAVVNEAVSHQIEDLLKRQTQFDVHFQEILKEHFHYEEQNLRTLQREVETCAATVQRHRAQIDMLSVMDMSTRSVVNNEEKKRLLRTMDSADSALKNFRDFRSMYLEFISDCTVLAHADALEHDYEALQHILAPCRDLVGGGASTSAKPTPTASPTSWATHSPTAAGGASPVAFFPPSAPSLQRSMTVPSARSVSPILAAAGPGSMDASPVKAGYPRTLTRPAATSPTSIVESSWPVSGWSAVSPESDASPRRRYDLFSPDMASTPASLLAAQGLGPLTEPQLPRIPRCTSPAPQPLQAPSDIQDFSAGNAADVHWASAPAQRGRHDVAASSQSAEHPHDVGLHTQRHSDAAMYSQRPSLGDPHQLSLARGLSFAERAAAAAAASSPRLAGAATSQATAVAGAAAISPRLAGGATGPAAAP